VRKERRSRSPLWARLEADQLEPLSKRSVAEQSVKSTLRTPLCCSTVPLPLPISLGTHRESQNPAKCPEFDPGSISTPSIHAPVDDTKTPHPPFPTQFTLSCGPALSLDCRLNAADETTIIEALLRAPGQLSGSSPSEPTGRVRDYYISQCRPPQPCHRIIQTTDTLITKTINRPPVIGQTIPF
jgi:hypothetical protein